MADDLTFPVQGEAIDYPQIAAPTAPAEQAIPTSVVTLPDEVPDTPLEKATAARLEGYTWPEIDGHIAQARQLADRFGYSQQQVDDHLGYRDPGPLLDKLSLDATDRMREQTPDADPLDLASAGLIKRTRDGLVADQVTPELRQDYASALTNGQVKSQQDFAEATTDAIGRAAGVDASPAARGIAAQLPDPRDATDYAIGVAHSALDTLGELPGQLHLNPTIPTAGMIRPLAPGEYLENPDHSWSNEMSWTVPVNGKPSVVPGLWLINGKPVHVSEDKATELAEQSGLKFPSFDTEKQAEDFADQREAQLQTAQRGDPNLPALWSGDLKPPPVPPGRSAIVNDTRTNMLNAWAETGQSLNDLYRAAHDDPLLQEALVTPQMLGPKPLSANNQSALDKYLLESGEALGDMYRQLPGAFTSLTQDIIKAGKTVLPGLIPGPAGTMAAKSAEVTSAFIKSLTGEGSGEGALEQFMTFLGGGLTNPLAPEVHMTAPLLTQAIKDGSAPGLEEGLTAFQKVMADETGAGRVRRIQRTEPPMLPEGVEPPVQPVQWRQLDDDLNRLRTNDAADKASIYNMARALPAEWRTPEFQTAVSHEVETRLTSAPDVSDKSQAYLTAIKPMTDERFALATKVAGRLEKLGLPAPELQGLKTTEQGYVPRIVAGVDQLPHELDPAVQRDLLTNGMENRPGGLSKFASSMQGRSDKMYVFDDGQGTRRWGTQPLADFKGKFGDVHTSPEDGKQWTITRPTMKEVEANTDITYQTNHFVNEAVTLARLKRIDRNLDFLENTIDRMKAAGQFIAKSDWRPNAPGNPPGMIPLRVGGIDGYAIPELARPINDFFGQKDDLLAFLDRSSSFLNKSLFISPSPHALNMAQLWTMNRSWDWIKPWDYGKQLSGMAQALHDVWTLSPRYLEHLRAGASLPYASVETENFHNLLLGKLFHEIMDDHPTWGPVSRALGFPGPDTWIKSMYGVSHRALWYVNDVLKYNREIEYERRGYALPDAIRLAEKDMVNYRVPSQVMGSSIASKAIQSPGLFNFGRYKYGLARSMVTMIADIAKPMLGKGSAQEAFDALGKASIVVLLSMAIPGLHSILGSHGVMAPIDAAKDMWHGQKDWASTVSTMVAPGPLLALADKIRSNRDVFGNALINPKASDVGELGEGIEQVLGQVYPGQLLIDGIKHGPNSVVDKLVGTKFFDQPYVPSQYQIDQEQRAAYAHDNHDAFVQAVAHLLGRETPATPAAHSSIHSRGRR